MHGTAAGLDAPTHCALAVQEVCSACFEVRTDLGKAVCVRAFLIIIIIIITVIAYTFVFLFYFLYEPACVRASVCLPYHLLGGSALIWICIYYCI